MRMIQVCARPKIDDCSANDALADAMSSIPNQAAMEPATINGIQTKPAFCIHSCVPSVAV